MTHGSDESDESDETQSLFVQGRVMPRVRLGEETPPEESPCATCGTYYFHVHEAGCDREQCPACGGQLIACDCGSST